MDIPLIPAVKATLWSYDTAKIDKVRDKELVITNVLNYGTKEATDWLFQVYDRDDIMAILKNPRPGEWNKKSLNLWSLMFDVIPEIRNKF